MNKGHRSRAKRNSAARTKNSKRGRGIPWGKAAKRYIQTEKATKPEEVEA